MFDRSVPAGQSAQAYEPDARNDTVLVSVNGRLMPRAEASVSVFDSGFVLGDGVWEAVRLISGRLIAFDEHMKRLFEGAKAIDLDLGHTPESMERLVRDTLAANGMTDGAHARIMCTRGVKSTPKQDPRFTVGPATIVVVAEYKRIDPETKKHGIALHTSTFRTSQPDVFDLRLNSHSRLNFIQALIQAIKAGADEALMLDPNGFVASCNSTNFFIVRDRVLYTSSGRYSFKGITQATVMRLAAADEMTVVAGDYTLAEVYAADEAFVTGTLGGIKFVRTVDGRLIGSATLGPVTAKLDLKYQGYLQGCCK